MSIFDQNSPQENSEELLYQAIKDELKPILAEWDQMKGLEDGGGKIVWEDPKRTKLIKDTSKIVLQFVWRKLGLKMPNYTRQVLDNDYNILEYKKEDK